MFDAMVFAFGKACGPNALRASSEFGAKENFIDCPDRDNKFGMYAFILSILSRGASCGSAGLVGTSAFDTAAGASDGAGAAGGDLAEVLLTGDAAGPEVLGILDVLAGVGGCGLLEKLEGPAAAEFIDIGVVMYFVKCGCWAA